MVSRWIMGLVVAGTLCLPAPAAEMSLDDLVEAGSQWVQDNVDDDLLRALQEVDQKQVRRLFKKIQNAFGGDYVFDLAELNRQVTAALPLLEAHSETRPYARWLRTRLDYFEVAEEWQKTVPPPKIEPGKPYPPTPNPTLDVQRTFWLQHLSTRPLPKEASLFVPRLKSIFVDQQVPPELVWIAEVESSFDPEARSPAGAAGLFQFMPATAQRMGISLHPRDERFMPEKSARASAQYLKYLYARFKDWPLALAAYNAGEGAIQQLMDRYKAKDLNEIASHLPAETQMYVPKINATLQRREGITLAKLAAPGAPAKKL